MSALSVDVIDNYYYNRDPAISGFWKKEYITYYKERNARKLNHLPLSVRIPIEEEASELIRRITEKDRPLPQFTSCCPGWVHFAEMYAPELLPHLSTAKSPSGMQGPTVKTYFAKKMGLDPEKIVHVALTPCTAKKFEIRRGELHGAADHLGIPGLRDTDQVIATRELARWTKAEGVDWNALEDSAYDSLMGQASGAGVIFGNTGGVMEAALRTAYAYITGESAPRAC